MTEPPAAKEPVSDTAPPATQPHNPADPPSGQSKGGQVGILVLVSLVVAGVALWAANRSRASSQVFSTDQLAKFDGSPGKPLYLAILGEVFDVSAGTQHYAKGEGYHHFIGRDGTRAFITGEFEDDLTDNVTDFTTQQCSGLVHWRGFFRNHTVYRPKGKVVGAFFDAAGNPLPALLQVEKLAAEAKTADEIRREQEKSWPRCNSRWNQAVGGFVWCDDGLFPRKIFTQLPNGKPTTRCACFKDFGWSDVRQVYDGCHPQDTECRVSPPPGEVAAAAAAKAAAAASSEAGGSTAEEAEAEGEYALGEELVEGEEGDDYGAEGVEGAAAGQAGSQPKEEL